MQEHSRDDFSLLNEVNDCDKIDNMCPTTAQRINSSPIPQITPTVATTTASATSFAGNNNTLLTENGNNYGCASSLLHQSHIKLEDNSNSNDLFPTHPTTWQQHPMNSHEHAHHRLDINTTSKLLLQSSDDPLICRGANDANDDDHPLEFRTLIAKKHYQQHQQQVSNHSKRSLMTSSGGISNGGVSGCSSLTKQQLKVKASLMSAQNHHQQQLKATNTTLNSVTEKSTPRNSTKPKKKSAIKLRFHHQALPPEYLSHYEATQGEKFTRNRIAAAGATTTKATSNNAVKVAQTAKLPPPKSAHENVRSWLQKIAEIQRTAEQQQQQQKDKNNNQHTKRREDTELPLHVAISNTNQHQLPNAVPTPKTQETIQKPLASLSSVTSQQTELPKRVMKYTDLPYMGEITLDNSKPRRGRKPKKADICHLIYKNYGTIVPGTPQNVMDQQTTHSNILGAALATTTKKTLSNDEPLNLCLRDQSNDMYSISSSENENNDEDGADVVGDDDDDAAGIRKTWKFHNQRSTPLTTTVLDNVTETLLATNLKGPLADLENNNKSLKHELDLDSHTAELNVERDKLQMHPVSVYYQKLLESGVLLQQNGEAFGLPLETIEKDNQLALKIPIPSGFFALPTNLEKSTTNSNHNTNSFIDYPEPMSTPSSIKSENSNTTAGTSTSTLQNLQLAPQKRKRSAIFIPPMPAENTTSPSTEVSICKFKFTGGAKPSLQEKKMLSVDADGNYRYYSGTGDKAMRGYEFFPRESLQQSGLMPGVHCAGAFLNATGEKISIDIPPPSADLSHELLQIPPESEVKTFDAT